MFSACFQALIGCISIFYYSFISHIGIIIIISSYEIYFRELQIPIKSEVRSYNLYIFKCHIVLLFSYFLMHWFLYIRISKLFIFAAMCITYVGVVNGMISDLY